MKAVPRGVVEWLHASAVPIRSTQPGTGLDDLRPLADVFRGARIVSLGEATHGTHEFFTIKHRLVELCMQELGFSTFGIEANYADSLAAAAYVRGEAGDAATALSEMRFWTWNTAEVLDLLRCSRAHNERAERPVSFYGYDVQFPASAVLAVQAYLRGRNSDLAAALDAAAFDTAVGMLPQLGDETAERVLQAADELTLSLPSPEMRLAARTIRQGIDMHAADQGPWGARDASMAENVGHLLDLDGPDARLVSWAHNAHAQRGRLRPGVWSMGHHLHGRFGREHVVVCFAFGEGEFQAVDPDTSELREHVVPMAPPGTLDHTLGCVEHDTYALDLRSAPEDVSEWFGTRPGSRSIGAGFRAGDPGEYVQRDLRSAADVLIYVRQTTAARRNHPVRLPADAEPVPILPSEAGTGSPWTFSTLRAPYRHRMEVQDGVLRISRDAPWPWGDGLATQAVEMSGRRLVRVTADVVARGEGRAAVFVRAEAKRGPLVASASFDRPVRDCRRLVELSLETPRGTRTLRLGAVFSGNGWAEFRDVRVS